MAKKEQNQALDVNDAISKSEAFILKYKKTLIVAIVAVVVIVGGIYVYNNFVAKPNAEKASTMLAKGQALFATGEYDKALNGDGAYIGFVKIADKYSYTKAGNLANLYAGLSYAQKGDAKNAIKYLEEFDLCGDDMISPAAIGALANCYAQVGKVDKAIDKLAEAAKKADNNTLSPIFLLQEAQLLESQNKNDEALKIYKEIKSKYFQSPEAAEIDKYIEKLSK